MKLKKLSEIFDIKYGNQFDFNKMEFGEDSDINFISRSSQNMGIIAKVDKFNNIEPFKEGSITVTLGGTYLLSSFLQQKPFYTAQNIKVLYPKDDMDEIEKLFYCYCITQNRFKYTSHWREANSTLDELLVPESMPEDRIDISIEKLNMLKKYEYKQSNLDLDIDKWKKFKITELFNLKKCKCSNAWALLEKGDDIYYIWAKKKQNWVMEKVELPKELVTSGWCIVFIWDGQWSIWYSSYQPIDFVWSTTLTAGYNEKLNKFNALFIVTVLDLERYRYSFGRKYGKEQLMKVSISLPPNKNWEPDWEFMENYIKSLPYSDNL